MLSSFLLRSARIIFPHRPNPNLVSLRYNSSSSKPPPGEGDDDDDDDMFDLSNFEMEELVEDDENLDPDDLSNISKDTPQEIAAEIVDRLLHSTPDSQPPVKPDIIPYLTPHTISVLRASRITRNAVYEAVPFDYVHPITRKVIAYLQLKQLGLSESAEEAVKVLAGKQRVHGDLIKVVANKFPTKEENQMLAVSRLDRLVRAAKEAVGEEVEGRKLESWDDVKGEVGRQAGEDILEAGSLSVLLGGNAVVEDHARL